MRRFVVHAVEVPFRARLFEPADRETRVVRGGEDRFGQPSFLCIQPP